MHNKKIHQEFLGEFNCSISVIKSFGIIVLIVLWCSLPFDLEQCFDSIKIKGGVWRTEGVRCQVSGVRFQNKYDTGFNIFTTRSIDKIKNIVFCQLLDCFRKNGFHVLHDSYDLWKEHKLPQKYWAFSFQLQFCS